MSTRDTMFAISNVCTAFAPNTIGTKVTDAGSLAMALARALASYDGTNDRVPGQHFVILPEGIPFVSAGVGRREGLDASSYVVREHRGRVELFLRRSDAAEVGGLAVVVYTKEAYMRDPEVTPEEVATLGNCTHVIVAVLGFAGPKAPLSPYRFVSNLAGGNNEALTYSADDIRAMAKDIKAYDDEWCVVAD